MNLIIDIGNSRVKLAIFKQRSMLFFNQISVVDLERSITETLANYPKIEQILLASVINLQREKFKALFGRYNPIFLDHKLKFPFVNLYKTPTTLGVDRLALASAAVCKYPDQNVVVIDLGSCLTYDFIDSKRNFHGGGISPGLQMRYKALNEYTDRLPLLDAEIPFSIIGNTTESAIHSGVVFGIINEIEGIVASYDNKYSNLIVILTGGDSNFLLKQLKISIFANSNFLLEGLNFLLEFNSNK